VLLALPTVFTDHHPPGHGVSCLSNTKQLALAWLMYATDYNDRLVRNQAYAGMSSPPTNNWVYGIMDWSANPDNTNAALFVDPAKSLFTAYNKNPVAYHCPADDSVSAAGPRVRSYSMNGFMGDTGRGPSLPGWRQYLKTSDLKTPAQKFVIVDEHPNSIDDGFFYTIPPGRIPGLTSQPHDTTEAPCLPSPMATLNFIGGSTPAPGNPSCQKPRKPWFPFLRSNSRISPGSNSALRSVGPTTDSSTVIRLPPFVCRNS
jgi:hypothetical protein